MKVKQYQIFIIFLFITACNRVNETVNPQSKENSDITIKNALQDYLDALINGDKEVIIKYFYKDAVKHFNKYANYEFKIDEFIEENIIKKVVETKKLYEEKGIKHYFKIEDEINNVKINNYLVSSFLVSDNVVLGEKSVKDTTKILAFRIGSDLEFIAISGGIENILGYRFSEIEVRKILNSAFKGKYSDYLEKNNDKFFKEYEWRLEALGQNEDNLLAYNNQQKVKMISEGIEVIEKIQFSVLKNKLELTNSNGEKKLANYIISSETIELPFEGITYKVKYTIKESGIGIYYLDLYLQEDNQGIVFSYQGYERKN